jgi:hypothetical protein
MVCEVLVVVAQAASVTDPVAAVPSNARLVIDFMMLSPNPAYPITVFC